MLMFSAVGIFVFSLKYKKVGLLQVEAFIGMIWALFVLAAEHVVKKSGFIVVGKNIFSVFQKMDQKDTNKPLSAFGRFK